MSQNTPIVIPAGTPEDKDLAAIAAESDAQKRIAAYQEFLTKYADNKPAVAYAEWQLSQQYLAAGDTAKAMEYGSKALAAYPNNLDIIMSQANVAQAMKDNGKVVDYAVQGAGVYHSIAKQPRAGRHIRRGMDLEDHRARRTRRAMRYDFLETSAYNAIASEQDPNKRMTRNREVHAGVSEVEVRGPDLTACAVQLAAVEPAAAARGLRRKGAGGQS